MQLWISIRLTSAENERCVITFFARINCLPLFGSRYDVIANHIVHRPPSPLCLSLSAFPLPLHSRILPFSVLFLCIYVGEMRLSVSSIVITLLAMVHCKTTKNSKCEVVCYKMTLLWSRLSFLIACMQAGQYVLLWMNVRVGILYWMDECLLNKRPPLMCLAKKKQKKNKHHDNLFILLLLY